MDKWGRLRYHGPVFLSSSNLLEVNANKLFLLNYLRISDKPTWKVLCGEISCSLHAASSYRNGECVLTTHPDCF